MKESLLKWFAQAMDEVHPVRLMTRHLSCKGQELAVFDERIDLSAYKKIHVIGMGKAATFMFKGLAAVLGDRIEGGIVVSLPVHHFTHDKVRFFTGSHPLPSQKSLKAGAAIIKYIQTRVSQDDLVICLISGGASALVVAPYPGISLKEKVFINRLLLSCGADINQINCIRKHISALKGGRLAQLISPVRLISLVISDVIDSPLESIASGICYGDGTTFKDAHRIMQQYHLNHEGLEGIKKVLLKGMRGKISDTPPPDADELKGNLHFILGDNLTLLEAMKRIIQKSRDFKVVILTSRDNGECSQAARFYASIMKEMALTGQPFSTPAMMLSGGELTVTLKGNGQGGRNQEFILCLLKELKGFPLPFFAASWGSDGIDGNSNAAGAWIDHLTWTKLKKSNLDIDYYRQRNDSHHFFKQLGQLIVTGATPINMMDIRLFFIGGEKSI